MDNCNTRQAAAVIAKCIHSLLYLLGLLFVQQSIIAMSVALKEQKLTIGE